MSLSRRELATVVAALRYWQRGMTAHHHLSGPNASTRWALDTSPDQFEAEPPLTVHQIDALCERLNPEEET